MVSPRIALIATGAASLLMGVSAHAADRDFNQNPGDWDVNANWDGGNVPTLTENVGIGNNSADPATVNIQAGTNTEARVLDIGDGNGTTGTVNLIGDAVPANAATLTTDREIEVADGTNETGTLNLGLNTTVNSGRSLDVGTGTNANASLILGDGATLNVLNNNNATFGGTTGIVSTLSFGTGATLNVTRDLAFRNGTYDLDPNHFLIGRSLHVGNASNEANNALVRLVNGNDTVQELTVGTANNNDSTFDLNGNTLTTTASVVLGSTSGVGNLQFTGGGFLDIGLDLQVRNNTLMLDATQIGVSRNIEVGNGNNEVTNAVVTQVGNYNVQALEVGLGNNNTSTYDVNGNTLTTSSSVTLGGDDSVGNLLFTGGGSLAIGQDLNFRNSTQSFTDAQISIGRNLNVGNTNNIDNASNLTLEGTFNGLDSISISNGRNNTASLTVIGSMTSDGTGDIRVSDNGDNNNPATGSLILGNATTGGNIDFTNNTNSDLFLRDADDNTATVRGWGSIDVAGDINPDGRIIADGDPTGSSPLADRTLDLTFDINNGDDRPITQGDGTEAGFYAVNRGRLVLDTITSVTADVTWGDEVNDATPDLVNSIRFDFDGSPTSGDLDVALLAEDHSSNTGTANTLINAIGFFDIEFTGTFTSLDMIIRYDALAANDENLLKVFRLQGGSWVEIASSLDTGNDRITAEGLTGFSQFAIAESIFVIPEPASAVLLALGGLLITCRGRRGV